MSKGLDSYSGRLTASEIAAGMNAARRNAQRLCSDASLLLEQERYPSAAALAVLSIEEAGKTSTLQALSFLQPPE